MSVWLAIFAGQVGLLWARWTPGRPLALMSVRPPATLIARACEGMGRPWRSLRGPKVIRHWVYHNWTENWCTRPACYRLCEPVGGPPGGGAGPVCKLKLRAVGADGERPPKIATVWPTKRCVAGGPSAT